MPETHLHMNPRFIKPFHTTNISDAQPVAPVTGMRGGTEHGTCTLWQSLLSALLQFTRVGDADNN